MARGVEGRGEEGGGGGEYVTASDAAIVMNQLKRLRKLERRGGGEGGGGGEDMERMTWGTGREGVGREGGWEGEKAERLMTVLESLVTVGMRQLDAKYMALALNAAVEGRRPSRELVSQAMQRIIAMRDDPVRDYVFTAQTMAQLFAVISRLPRTWVDPAVIDTLCLVVINGGGGSKDGWGRGGGGEGRPRGPWRLGSSGAGASLAGGTLPSATPPVGNPFWMASTGFFFLGFGV